MPKIRAKASKSTVICIFLYFMNLAVALIFDAVNIHSIFTKTSLDRIFLT